MVYTEKVPFLIRHNVPLSYVEIIWNGNLTNEQLSSGMSHLLAVLEEKQVKLLLVDSSGLFSSGPEAQIWIKDFYQQVLQNRSIERIARVVDHNAFGQAVLSNMLYIHQTQLAMASTFSQNSFSDRGEALEWLLREVSA